MAYGKKNHVSINPLSYSICLLGEVKSGKTTLIKNVCEKLAGNDGYIFAECGMERGADCIEDINYVNCPSWNMDYDELSNSLGFADLCEDIIKNKTTEYPKLQALVIDTYDQLITIAEEETVRLWNKECKEKNHPEKKCETINSAYSGYGRGEKKAIELMFNYISQLRDIGVSTIVIGHCKTKDVVDIYTGESYQTLTSDQTSTYFNALKKNLHFLGLAYIDRTLAREKSSKKINGKNVIVNKVTDETRKIRFRDSSYTVDSGCRFADITPEINMDADEFIKAITDAIESEIKNAGKSIDERVKEDNKREKELEKRVAESETQSKDTALLKSKITIIKGFCVSNKGNIEAIKPILDKIKELGYDTPKEIDSIEAADEVLELISLKGE